MQFASSRPGSPRMVAKKAQEANGPSSVVSMLEAKVNGS